MWHGKVFGGMVSRHEIERFGRQIERKAIFEEGELKKEFLIDVVKLD